MQKNIKIADILPGTKNWLTLAQGTAVYNVIRPVLDAGDVVCLDFSGHDLMVTPFLNGAVGPLFDGSFPFESLQKVLVPHGFKDQDEEERWERVIANAKSYYANPELHDSVNAEV